MNNDEYFDMLSKYVDKAYEVANRARGKGYDPEMSVEIRPAPDLATKVEGILDIDGLAALIKSKDAKSRQELAFKMVEEVCTNKRFESEIQKRMTLAVRVGLSVLTEGILVAPTEGFQGVFLYKNPDGSDYVSAVYAGPIRGAGGTSAALSVALTDYARKLMGVGIYKPQKSEVERYVEEIGIYHHRKHLQYLPSDDDIRTIIENCPVCVDGLATEDAEIGIHRNIKRTAISGKEEMITNRIRGGVPLVLCEGVAQKAKSVLKYTKAVGLDWTWLNNIIRAEKADKSNSQDHSQDNNAVFLRELVAGRPVFAYPNHPGSFRLRYGRSRLTGIAAKGFSPSTMILLDEFIATGTQLKVEKPGKGCIAMPVDSIEGPFVKLDDGRAFRINDPEIAMEYKDHISKIMSVGDILITYGDFKKTNTALLPTSYVEEYWYAQLSAAGYSGGMPEAPSFKDALQYSIDYSVPMHPLYIYNYNDITNEDLGSIAAALSRADLGSNSLFDISSIRLTHDDSEKCRDAIERICIPHTDRDGTILIEGGDAQALLCSMGFIKDGKVVEDREGAAKAISEADPEKLPAELLSSIAPFKIMQRSTYIGGRQGRPEKAKERLMAPPPNVLFPIGEKGGKERSISKAYIADKKRFGAPNMEIEIARYRCQKGKESLPTAYCHRHESRAYLERICPRCMHKTSSDVCENCGTPTMAYEMQKVDIADMLDSAMKNLGLTQLPKLIKGVKGMMNKSKEAEPIEKGILRSVYGVHIFKDGTSRFDATDAPITHFYPKEIGTSIERLLELGYTEDYDGKPLESPDQLVELKHQDVILNHAGAEFVLRVSKFIDALLVKYYKVDPFYKADSKEDLIGHAVVTLSPHTSTGFVGRIIGYADVNVGLAHPYLISARRRNCDGDEDTTILLLDALINFSKHYLPTTIGGTMDAPLILAANIKPEEVDDEVWNMEVDSSYSKDFYDKTMQRVPPGEAKVGLVESRLKTEAAYSGLKFTHATTTKAMAYAPKRSAYTTLKTMQDKIDMQFSLSDKLYSIDRADAAKRLILSHFIPDLMGNLHSFSKQTFRCISCNAKYRRVPLIGKCPKCGGKLVLTISKGGIEKYLNTAINLSERYKLEPYIRQRIMLLKQEIETVFGAVGAAGDIPTKQFNLANFM